ncbi:DUF3080 family protein [Congregibacter brevis]|uniref:DUF3080 family protein n=1 Tax=Congregibacter brevis TaxID=3081201 RepID=A0ABZ0IE74_9GAMM|nr:DUF3080 family protein [Congregibacter sp. IMCC45268]
MRPLVVAALILLLIACTAGGQSAELENYLERLARPLGFDAPPVENLKRPLPPRAESLHISLPGSKLDGLDFLRLRGCALQQTIARRNSSLGRVAPPSQRLLLELAFLRDAPACIETLRSDGRDELAELIQETATLKKSQLPALVFNATLGNREYRDFWRATAIPEDYPVNTSSLAITALEQITADAIRWMSGDFEADDIAFELALSEVAKGDGGELLAALSRQAAYLNAGNELIAKSIAQGPLCTTHTLGPAAPIVRTVVNKFFIQEIQARAASINQRHYALIEPVSELELLLSQTLPDDYERWRVYRETTLADGTQSTKDHVAQLQALLGICYAEFATKA